MTRKRIAAALAAALGLAGEAAAQGVEVAPLKPPDLFSPAGRDTGLPPTLWRGASVLTARTVLPMLAARPLSPAAAALARRVLATGAEGPEGAGQDLALAGARVQALTALGDLKSAAAILSRTTGLEKDPQLSQAAAEAALLAGDTDAACATGEALTIGRDEPYWLRLRAYCQVRAGRTAAAQLTFDLAQAAARDPVYGRLMIARLSGGEAGSASLRNGLDYALSRDLKLDLAAAKPAPAVAAALSAAQPGAATWTLAPGPGQVRAAAAALAAGDLARAQQIRAGLVQDQIPDATRTDLAVLDAALAVAAGRPDGQTLDRLVERGATGEARARAQTAAVLLAAAGSPLGAVARGELAGFTSVEAKAPTARVLALDLAGHDKAMGEAALLALWTAAEAGPSGLAAGDRARIVRALRAAGLEADARNFALEGLLALL